MRMPFAHALAAVLIASATVRAADPPLPPIVFQMQPEALVLDQLRGAATHVGGEPAVKRVNMTLKELFGEKGLEGFDINRPIVGYVVLAPKPEDITVVLALPITNEKDFLALCDRVNRDKLRVDEKDKTLYHLPPLNPKYKAMMRFADQYAYIAYGFNPAPNIDAKALVPMPKLYDPAERGLIAARVHFDRIPVAVKLAAPVLFAEVKKTLFGGFNLDRPQNEWMAKAITPELEKLVVRYAVGSVTESALLVGDADVLTARLTLDNQAANLVAEATLTAKPNTKLAKIIADYKTAPNRFGAIMNHGDNVFAFQTRAPLFAPEVRAAVAAALEAGGKRSVESTKEVDKAWTEETFKGFVRVVKTQELDVAAAMRGPDKDGWFTVVGAVAFDDPAALEKAAKISFKKDAPQDAQDRMKWDADKVGNVNIHVFHFPQGGFFDFTKFLGGEKCYSAFAFAPQGLIGVIGPDPVPVLKEVLAAKPVATPAMDMIANPGRIVKVFEKASGPEHRSVVEAARLLGRDDKKVPVMSVVVEGGKELKATFTINLKLLPKVMFADALDRAAPEPLEPAPKPVPPEVEKK